MVESNGPAHGAVVDTCGQRYEQVTLGPLLVLCKRHVGDYAKVGSAWAQLLSFAARMGMDVTADRVGILYDDPSSTPSEHIRYDACLVTTEEQAERLRHAATRVPPDGIRIESIAAITAWRTVHRGSFQALAQVYAAVSAADAFEPDGIAGTPPFYEIYRTDPVRTPPEAQVTEVYLPLPEDTLPEGTVPESAD